MRWFITYKVHALRDHARGPYKPWLRSSISLWPSSRGKRDRQGWRPRLRKQKWYESCRRELARHGYHGDWLSSPWGRFGDYWRRLSDADDLTAELQRLDRMHLQATSRVVSFGTPSPRSGRRKVALRRHAGGDAFFELWSSFTGLLEEWRTSSFVLQKVDNVAMHGTRWKASYRIVHGPRRLGSAIALWPSLRSVRTRGGWHPRLLQQKWYQTCAAELGRRGYKGEWKLWDVRYGDFMKRLKDARAAAAELKRLDRRPLEPLWSK
jgi:hypothetical protein